MVRASAPVLATALDEPDSEKAIIAWRRLAAMFYNLMAGKQTRLAASTGRVPKDFEFTVAAAMVGRHWCCYLQVGDGGLVVEQNGDLSLLVPPDRGEFANQTRFVQPGADVTERMHVGLVPVAHLTGIAAFSDGTGEQMIEHLSFKPSRAFQVIFDDIRMCKFRHRDIFGFLSDPKWDRIQDDRSLALLALGTNRHENSPTDDCKGNEKMEPPLPSLPHDTSLNCAESMTDAETSAHLSRWEWMVCMALVFLFLEQGAMLIQFTRWSQRNRVVQTPLMDGIPPLPQ